MGFIFNLALASLIAIGASAGLVMAEDGVLTRGEAVDLTVKNLDLESRHRTFLRECDADLDACFFTFSTRTNFDEIRLQPLILYPDVYPAYRYYRSINVASKLDLVRGYFEEENSPFRPEQPITRIEALKLVMGASDVLSWKEKFELTNEVETSWIKIDLNGEQWWYARYLAAAVENGFWESTAVDTVDSSMGKQEFLKLLENANKIVASGQTTSLVDTMADTYGQTSKKADASGNTAL